MNSGRIENYSEVTTFSFLHNHKKWAAVELLRGTSGEPLLHLRSAEDENCCSGGVSWWTWVYAILRLSWIFHPGKREVKKKNPKIPQNTDKHNCCSSLLFSIYDYHLARGSQRSLDFKDKKPLWDSSLTSSTALTQGFSAILTLSPALLSDLQRHSAPV